MKKLFTNETVFYLEGLGTTVKMVVENGSYVLRKGSKIAEDTVPSLWKYQKIAAAERTALYKYGTNNGKTLKDLVFNSISGLEVTVTGRSAKGPSAWKTADGVALSSYVA